MSNLGYARSLIWSNIPKDLAELEAQKVVAEVKRAGITLTDLINLHNPSYCTNESLYKILKKNPQIFLEEDAEILYTLAAAAEFASAMVQDPALLKIIPNLGASRLCDLCNRHSSVCSHILKNSELAKLFTGYHLASISKHYASKEKEIVALIDENRDLSAKKEAYCRLWDNFSNKTEALVLELEIESNILGLLKTADLVSNPDSGDKDLSDKDSGRQALFRHSPLVTLVLLKNKCCGPQFPQDWTGDLSRPFSWSSNVSEADFLLKNESLLRALLNDPLLFNSILFGNKAICLFVLERSEFYPKLTGQMLDQLLRRYAGMVESYKEHEAVCDIILQSPALIDKYRGYNQLYQLLHQKNLTLSQESKSSDSQMLSGQNDYERACFALGLEKIRLDIAYHYFTQAARANHPLAIKTLEQIKNFIQFTDSSSRIKSYLRSAEGFSDPSGPCHNAELATFIYQQLYSWIGSTSFQSLDTKISDEIIYSLACRAVLGLGMKEEQILANACFQKIDDAYEGRARLINLCTQDIKQRKKITAEHPESKVAQVPAQSPFSPILAFLETRVPRGMSAAQSYKKLIEFCVDIDELAEAARLTHKAIAGDLTRDLSSKHCAQLGAFKKRNQETQSALCFYLQALRNGWKEERKQYITEISSLIPVFLATSDDLKKDPLFLSNLKTILSLSDLCSVLETKTLYAIFLLQGDRFTPLALPLTPAPTAGDEKSSELKEAKNYIDDLLAVAKEEAKSENSLNGLFGLAASFLNIEKKAARQNYQKYFQAGMRQLFETLELASFDPQKNLITQLYEAAKTCEQSADQGAWKNPYAEKFRKLAGRLLNNELEDLLETKSAKPIEQAANRAQLAALQGVFSTQAIPWEIFTQQAREAIFKYPSLWTSLSPAIFYQGYCGQRGLPDLSPVEDAKQEVAADTKSEDLIQRCFEQLIEWLKTQENSGQKLQALLCDFIGQTEKDHRYGHYTSLYVVALEFLQVSGPIYLRHDKDFFEKIIFFQPIQTIQYLYPEFQSLYVSSNDKHLLIASLLRHFKQSKEKNWVFLQERLKFLLDQWEAEPSFCQSEGWLIFNGLAFLDLVAEMNQSISLDAESGALLSEQDALFKRLLPDSLLQQPLSNHNHSLHAAIRDCKANPRDPKFQIKQGFFLRRGIDVDGASESKRALAPGQNIAQSQGGSLSARRGVERRGRRENAELLAEQKEDLPATHFLPLAAWSWLQPSAIASGILGLLTAWLGAMTLWATAALWAWWLIGVGLALVGVALILAALSLCCRKKLLPPPTLADFDRGFYNPDPAEPGVFSQNFRPSFVRYAGASINTGRDVASPTLSTVTLDSV